jgi:hypothetical protein
LTAAVQARPCEYDVFRPLPESDDEVASSLSSIKIWLIYLSGEVEQDP